MRFISGRLKDYLLFNKNILIGFVGAFLTGAVSSQAIARFTSPLVNSLVSRERQQMRQTVQTQTQTQKYIMKYCSKIIENVVKKAGNKQICCMDFIMDDVGKASKKQALALEKAYDDNRIAGLMCCTYKTNNLLNSEIKDLIELFELHDQIFILKEDEVYKLHMTKENVHKLFLS